MANVARAFDEQNQHGQLHGLPANSEGTGEGDLPWATVNAGGMPPMMFELRFQDGSVTSFPYGDVRQIHCAHAGRVELYLFGIGKVLVTIEGRHLRDLASWFGNGLVRWVQEADPRAVEKPEAAPEIESILLEELAD